MNIWAHEDLFDRSVAINKSKQHESFVLILSRISLFV